MKNVFTIEENGVLQPDCYSNKLMLYNGICKSFPGFKQHKHSLMFDAYCFSYDISNRFFQADFTYPRLLALCAAFIKEGQPIRFGVLPKENNVFISNAEKWNPGGVRIKQLNIISKVIKNKNSNGKKQVKKRIKGLVKI
jgi:hypothetical protein